MIDRISTKSILKSVLTLGSSQGLIVICSLIRVKIVALLLGPTATGLFTIFNNVVDVVGGVTRLDIRRVAQREISRTGSKTVIESVLKTSWLLGLTGGLLMIILSPTISKITFDNLDMTLQVAALGCTLVALSLQEGYYSVMTGCGDTKRFAISQVLGALTGLIASIPLFLYLGLKSIVPSIIVYSVASALIARFFVRREFLSEKKIRWHFAIKTMMPTLKFGIWITAAAFITRACDYCFIAWMTKNWSIDTVGVYSAGSTMINRGAGLILAALAADYYTRISAISNDDSDNLNRLVRSQVNVLLSVSVPCMIIFVLFSKPFVTLFYSSEYLSVIPYFAGASASVPIKIASWALAFVILARGAGKVYLLSETVSALISLVINIISFKFGGLELLGYATLANELIYVLIVSVVCHQFNISLSFKEIAIILISSLIIILASIIKNLTIFVS
ncbi:MAG: oligosaccharide flippase family protein [Muribaculaceae bacterium]|nr:oligosaccharide flippase family protein [Muribaculaceae bacterium]